MRSHTSNSHQQQENNFLGLRRQSKADRVKEILFKTAKIIIVIIVLATGIIFGLSKLQKGKPQATTPHYDANITQEPSDSDQKAENDSKSDVNSTVENPNSSTTTQSQRHPHNTATTRSTITTNNTTTTQPDNYDPSKCQSYLDASNNLEDISDAKYREYQYMLDNWLDYTTIYENSGRNAVVAEQTYNEQVARTEAKQQEWKDNLSARNKTYEKYQSCMGSL